MSKKPEKPVICSAHFNESVIVESAEHNHTTSGAIIIRSILERTGIINFLVSGLEDSRITHKLAQLLIQCIVMLTLGWGLLDVSKVNGDPGPQASQDMATVSSMLN